jgi:hypothetical protein
MLQRIQNVSLDVVKSDDFTAILLWTQIFRDVRLYCWVRFSWCCKGSAALCLLEVLENLNTDSIASQMIWILKVGVVYSREIQLVFHTIVTSEPQYCIVWWKWVVIVTALGYFHVFYIFCALDIAALSSDGIYKWFLHIIYLLYPCWWPSKGWNVVEIIIVSQGNLEEIKKLPITAFCWTHYYKDLIIFAVWCWSPVCIFGRYRIFSLFCKLQDFPKIASLHEKVMLLGI